MHVQVWWNEVFWLDMRTAILPSWVKFMNRRSFLLSTAAATVSAPHANAGQFTGKIRKSLKWSMAQKAAQGMPLVEAF